MISTKESILEDIVSRLSKGIKVEQIYLFGSQATDRAGEASDFDMLVVVPSSDLPRHRREAYFYDLLWGLSTPVDVVVLTRQEFQRSVQVKTSLASTAKTKGMLVYG